MNCRLMKGNEAAVYGALMGGCTHFFGYPITPASEIAQAAAYYFTASGRTFLQAESEISVINMLYGAASAGARVMTASSGPGIALMGEGLSYLAGARLPAVVIDMQRAGPGLGNIWPEQSDYNMVVKGGGHGNYANITLTPASAQEMFDFTKKAFQIADTYRMTVCILSDAYIGQMMEPVEISGPVLHGQRKEWAVYGDKASRKNLISSIYMSAPLLRKHNEDLQQTYLQVAQDITDYEEISVADAEFVFVAYGIVARICHSVVQALRQQGIKAGLLRPKTVFPFPTAALGAIADRNIPLGVVELSNGQMANDVDLAVKGRVPVFRYLTMGGETPTVRELLTAVKCDLAESKKGGPHG
ncbi:MAG: 3-methyl-2-oxobutanoate dehydrogenase subunit VorB [Sphaerochaetaceae bacterium]|nr:3-methyl-2-oxobutanoate dehydrogenase subunit VorB [Sphaerochaetaceae bacterium]MDD4219010.1 3-methyl-2-oxobutanoate dehydrogenase subunit VorB [Sphaerochaetaceae bacterium]MDY0371897.1 3-methyl-2-oxobutanoate dehydrogenase subunit VorB [Sphaerochaetaceae bacterium]